MPEEVRVGHDADIESQLFIKGFLESGNVRSDIEPLQSGPQVGNNVVERRISDIRFPHRRSRCGSSRTVAMGDQPREQLDCSGLLEYWLTPISRLDEHRTHQSHENSGFGAESKTSPLLGSHDRRAETIDHPLLIIRYAEGIEALPGADESPTQFVLGNLYSLAVRKPDADRRRSRRTTIGQTLHHPLRMSRNCSCLRVDPSLDTDRVSRIDCNGHRPSITSTNWNLCR